MPAAELAAVAHVVDEHVRQRRVELVGAVHAEQARDRALDRHGRLAGDLARPTCAAICVAACWQSAMMPGSRSSLAVALIEMSRTIGNGITSRSVSRSVRIITSRSTPMPPPAVGE